jgi:hypothetical protein
MPVSRGSLGSLFVLVVVCNLEIGAHIASTRVCLWSVMVEKGADII